LQRALVRNLSVLAERASKLDLIPLWAGQSAGLSRLSDAKTLLQSLVAEVSAIAGPALRWSHERRELRSSKQNRWNSTGLAGAMNFAGLILRTLTKDLKENSTPIGRWCSKEHR